MVADLPGGSPRADAVGTGDAAGPWPSSRGLLRLSRFDPGGSAGEPEARERHTTVHRSTYVNGPDYCGMTDNDIRGYRDGGFIWGWNQATQIHVRLGRNGEFGKPKYGEIELMRVLQRWEAITLPPEFELSACRLTMHVEEEPPSALRLFLYAVARDWNPGSGGVDRNNVSAPEPGEVWWNDAAHGQTEWAHPGAGFASDTDPGADTGAHALAEAVCEPGQDRLVFESSALARYAAGRIREGEPLLLLLKLTDAQEDTPGCFFSLFSGEHGDSRNTVRRPRLELEWSSRAEVESVADEVFLEHGRVCQFPELPGRSSGRGPWMASFEPAPGCIAPTVQVRDATGDSVGPWRQASQPFEPAGERFQLRLLAMPDPIELGECFEAELADTWVLTGPPETQSVPWTFESPSGSVHTVRAVYQGGYRWRVRFQPDEVGVWRYRWTQSFLPEPYHSTTGEFCVWGSRIEEVERHLARLEEAVAMTPRANHGPLYARLYALEREGVRLLAPDAFRGPEGERLRAALRAVRSALWGKPVPEPIPMLSHRLARDRDAANGLDPVLDASRYEQRERDRLGASRARSPIRRLRKLATRLAGRLRRGPA